MLIVHLPPLFLVISQILVRCPFPVCSRCVAGNACVASHACTASHALRGLLVASICVVLHFCFGACPVHTYFYGAVIVDLFIVILTVTLREIAAVFVMLGCCEFRNEMYKCSCWVSLFLYFCAPIFCYCLVNCKCNHRVFITHGWHTFRYDATGKTITLFSKIVKLSGKFRKFLVSDWWNQGSINKRMLHEEPH